MKLGMVGLALLFALSACDLFNQLQVDCSGNIHIHEWKLAHVVTRHTTGGGINLTGVDLTIAAVTLSGTYASAPTPDFSLSKGQSYSSTIDMYMG